MKMLDLAGKRFHELTVLRRGAPSASGRVRWECRCDCGATITVQSNNLMSGNTKSCGCTADERTAIAHTVHGHNKSHTEGGPSPEYISWQRMKSRCHNERDPKYPDYGGRGISVCSRWLDSFVNFLADMGPRPADTTLDRYPDNDGDYEPDNCRWATPVEQRANRRRAKPRNDASEELAR